MEYTFWLLINEEILSKWNIIIWFHCKVAIFQDLYELCDLVAVYKKHYVYKCFVSINLNFVSVGDKVASQMV